MDKKRFAQQMAFALEIDKEKNIFRQTHLSNHGRNENDENVFPHTPQAMD